MLVQLETASQWLLFNTFVKILFHGLPFFKITIIYLSPKFLKKILHVVL